MLIHADQVKYFLKKYFYDYLNEKGIRDTYTSF